MQFWRRSTFSEKGRKLCPANRRVGNLRLNHLQTRDSMKTASSAYVANHFETKSPVKRWFQRWHEKNCGYRITSRWVVPGNCAAVASTFLDLESMSNWWPQFLDVDIREPGDDLARGRRVAVTTKGFLPYRLHFQFRVTKVEHPRFFSVQATGEFNGRGRGWLTQSGDEVEIHFDWHLEVGKPLLRWWSWLLKPLFIANHRWLMGRGEQGLQQQMVL